MKKRLVRLSAEENEQVAADICDEILSQDNNKSLFANGISDSVYSFEDYFRAIAQAYSGDAEIVRKNLSKKEKVALGEGYRESIKDVVKNISRNPYNLSKYCTTIGNIDDITKTDDVIDTLLEGMKNYIIDRLNEYAEFDVDIFQEVEDRVKQNKSE